MAFDLLERRREKFILWIPATTASTRPALVLGIFDPGPPATIDEFFTGYLTISDQPDLWELNLSNINPPLKNDTVYHYWFEIQDSSPEHRGTMRVTDPIAYTVDYRAIGTRDKHVQPASVIKFRDGKLWPCDIDGNEPSQVAPPPQDAIPDNKHMVIYELPASWAKGKQIGDVQVDVGTFTDVLALFDLNTAGDRFRDISPVANEAILPDLGINALELLPAADAKPRGEWGYGTAHYYAPDFDLGTASELVKLVKNIHLQGVRLFTDVVMAFGHDPYIYIAFMQFHVNPKDEPNNLEEIRQSHSNALREAWGGRLWRYIKDTHTYDPKSGRLTNVHPSWSFHQGHLHRWMSDFGIGGFRLDSVNNIANFDFIKSYTDEAWSLYRSRYEAPVSSKFLVIGEELSVPVDMVTSGTVNALWNEPFQGRLRAAILGESAGGDNFEWTVRKMINCTLDWSHPFTDGQQAINYITSHDTEGFRKERLFNFLSASNIHDIERRSKLAFACLLTAVGIPMIFAGEEFCDQMDRPVGLKQVDPVNYERKAQDWRARVFNYVANLVRLRKECPALGVDDTQFIHVDESRGGKIMAWKRGAQGQAPVVVVANFTDQDTPGDEYFVKNWPERQRGDWREVTQGRHVPRRWVGREPLLHWEAKVYTYQWRFRTPTASDIKIQARI
ncbi:glycoside hydrolase superfamily [Aspergillus tamarii]|uniref:Glycoside hydrolase superfamily n=1 Tax=Aspergillus tamarii TaxID=41984 RepID=A0A5N6UKY5_ASPTM|nr:glycoside hydrolase superfamily [Aspergillus tamarii]